MADGHDEVCARSLEDPDGLWRGAAEAVDWSTPFELALDARSFAQQAGARALCRAASSAARLRV